MFGGEERDRANAPDDDHEEVENVPEVAEVGVLAEHEAQREDLQHRLGAEDAHEVHLCLILRIDYEYATYHCVLNSMCVVILELRTQ